MPVYKEDNGSYTVRYYAKDIITEQSKQIRKRGFKTRREAVAWEAESKALKNRLVKRLEQMRGIYERVLYPLLNA